MEAAYPCGLSSCDISVLVIDEEDLIRCKVKRLQCKQIGAWIRLENLRVRRVDDSIYLIGERHCGQPFRAVKQLEFVGQNSKFKPGSFHVGNQFEHVGAKDDFIRQFVVFAAKILNRPILSD